MVLGFDAKRLFCNHRGLGSYSRSVVKSLISYYPNIQIHLFSPQVYRNEETELFFHSPNITIHKASFFGRLWRTLKIPFIARKINLEVYHGLSSELPLFPFMGKMKKIITIHDVIFKSFPEFYNPIDRWIYDLKLKWSLRYANKILCISEHTKSELTKYYRPDPDKIRVIHPILNPLFFNSDSFLKSSEFKKFYNLKNGYWLVVGNLYGRKNVIFLLSALAHLPESKRKKLVIVTKDNAQNVIDEAKKLMVDDWIRIETDVTDRVLSLYYQNCTAVIYPSIEEGFGLPILEAIAHSATVICSDRPAHREAGGNLPIFFDPENSHMLANILTSLSYHERKSKTETLSHLNIYNPKLICDSLISLYREDQKNY